VNRELRPRTLEAHGRLWGARARDWANFQEGTVRPVFQAVLERTRVGPGTRYLDAGCGSVMAVEMAAAHEAEVSGVDAAESMLSIACAEGRLPPRRSGGAAVWKPRWHGSVALLTALKSLLPSAPAGAPGPFVLSDETILRQFAADAGLEPIEVFDVDSPRIYADETAALRGLTSTGNAVRAMEQIDEKLVTQAYARAIGPFRQSDGSYRATAWFRRLLARQLA